MVIDWDHAWVTNNSNVEATFQNVFLDCCRPDLDFPILVPAACPGTTIILHPLMPDSGLKSRRKHILLCVGPKQVNVF